MDIKKPSVVIRSTLRSAGQWERSDWSIRAEVLFPTATLPAMLMI